MVLTDFCIIRCRRTKCTDNDRFPLCKSQTRTCKGKKTKEGYACTIICKFVYLNLNSNSGSSDKP